MGANELLHVWLGIPQTNTKIDYYTLLGLTRFEGNAETIKAAFATRLAQVAPHLAGENANAAKRLIARLESARNILLDARRKELLDAQLRSLETDDLRLAPLELVSAKKPAATVIAPTRERPSATAGRSGDRWRSDKHETAPRSSRSALWLAVAAGGVMLVVGMAAGISIAIWLVARGGRTEGDRVAVRATVQNIEGALKAEPASAPPAINSNAKAGTTAVAKTVRPPTGSTPQVPSPPSPAPTPATAVDAQVTGEVRVKQDSLSSPTPEPASDKATDSELALDVEMEEWEEDPSADIDLASLLAESPATLPPPNCRSEEDRRAYIEHVRAMLEAGLGKSRSRAKTQEHYRQALALCQDDPRLYYGYALTLYTTQRAEAAELLALAEGKGAFPYHAVAKLKIYMEAAGGFKAEFLKRLPELARYAESDATASGDEAGRLELAHLLGVLVGFWSGPSSAAQRYANELAMLDMELTDILGVSRRTAYKLGKSEVTVRIEEITIEIEQRRAEQELDAQRQAASTEQKLKSKARQLDDVAEQKVRDKEKADQEFKIVQNEVERECLEMARQKELLDRQVVRLQGDIARAVREISYWRGVRETLQKTQKNSSGTAISNAELMITEIAVKRAGLEAGLRQLHVQREGLGIRARACLQQYERIKSQYQFKVGSLVKETETLAALKNKLEKISKAEARRNQGSGSYVAQRAKATMLSSYVVLDINQERERIERSYRFPD